MCHEAERKWRADEASLMLTGTVKTGKLCGCRDESIGNLFNVWAAVGVEATGARHRLVKGTGESCDIMPIEKYKLTNVRV